jgi:glutamyl-tRNA reductase
MQVIRLGTTSAATRVQSGVVGLAMVGVSHSDVALSALDEVGRNVRTLACDLVVEPHAGVDGAVLLSTCNRVEIYLDAQDPRRAAGAVSSMFRTRMGGALEVPPPRMGEDVVRHLFSVAAGLESMVIGEDQISGQVRRALRRGHEDRTASPQLERLFQAACATSKRVSSAAGLGAAGRSIASVAIDLVERDHGPVDGRRVLLIGTGSFARVAHAAVVKRGARPPMVFSSSGRAHLFVASHGGTAIEADDLLGALREADLVVSCSGAPHAVLDTETVRLVVDRRARPLPILDLALTQDVEDGVKDLPHVSVIDLDVVSAHAPLEHSEAVQHAHQLIKDAVASFATRESERSADTAIVALRSHVYEAMERERHRVHAGASAEVAAAVEESLRHFVGELLHGPTIRARQYSREGFAEEFDRSVRTVFGID